MQTTHWFAPTSPAPLCRLQAGVMIVTLPLEIMDLIVDGLSPQDMARAAASHSCFRASVERVVALQTANLGRLGSYGGAALAPSAGEGWAGVALYAAQLKELPIGGGSANPCSSTYLDPPQDMKTWYLQAAKDDPLPLWSIDPRLGADADTTPLMVLHEQVSRWHARVLAVFRTDDCSSKYQFPPWEDEADYARECFEKDTGEDASDSDLVFDSDTAFRVISERFVIQDFLDEGIWPAEVCGYHMGIVRGNGYERGWQGFHGSSSSRIFLSCMTDGRIG